MQQQQQHGGGGRVGAKMKELVVRVEYSGGGDGGAGLHFWGHYASTDNQVGLGPRPYSAVSCQLLAHCSLVPGAG
jgi:hypothetical protein